MSKDLWDFQEWLDRIGKFEYVEQYDKEKKEEKLNIDLQTYEDFCKWLSDKGQSALVYLYENEHKKTKRK